MLKILIRKIGSLLNSKKLFYLPCFISFSGLILGILLAVELLAPLAKFYYKYHYWSILLSMAIFILHKNRAILFILTSILGVVFTLNCRMSQERTHHSLYKNLDKSIIVSGKICSHGNYKKGYWHYKLGNITQISNKKFLLNKDLVFNIQRDEPLDIYTKLKVKGILNSYSTYGNKYYTLKSIEAISVTRNKNLFVIAAQLLLQRLNISIDKIESPDNRAILRSLLTGNRGDLSNSQKIVFRNSGMSHMLALSGLHIMIIITFLITLTRPIPVLIIYKNLIIIFVLWIFFLSAGTPPTLFRATTASTIYLAASMFQRSSNSINALSAAGLIWLLLNPLDLFTVSFQLSFVASFTILLLLPLLNHRSSRIGNIISKKLYQAVTIPLILTLAIICFTLPIISFHFGKISIGAIFLNIPILLLVNISFFLFLTGTIFSFPFISEILISLSSTVITVMFDIIQFFSEHFPCSFSVSSPDFGSMVIIIIAMILLLLLKRDSFLITLVTIAITVTLLFIPFNKKSNKKHLDISVLKFPNSKSALLNFNGYYTIGIFNYEKRSYNLSILELLEKYRKLYKGNSIELVILRGYYGPKDIKRLLEVVNIKDILITNSYKQQYRKKDMRNFLLNNKFRYYNINDAQYTFSILEENIVFSPHKKSISIKLLNANMETAKDTINFENICQQKKKRPDKQIFIFQKSIKGDTLLRI